VEDEGQDPSAEPSEKKVESPVTKL